MGGGRESLQLLVSSSKSQLHVHIAFAHRCSCSIAQMAGHQVRHTVRGPAAPPAAHGACGCPHPLALAGAQIIAPRGFRQWVERRGMQAVLTVRKCWQRRPTQAPLHACPSRPAHHDNSLFFFFYAQPFELAQGCAVSGMSCDFHKRLSQKNLVVADSVDIQAGTNRSICIEIRYDHLSRFAIKTIRVVIPSFIRCLSWLQLECLFFDGLTPPINTTARDPFDTHRVTPEFCSSPCGTWKHIGTCRFFNP